MASSGEKKRSWFQLVWIRYIDPMTSQGEPARSDAVRYVIPLGVITLILYLTGIIAPFLGGTVLALPLGGLILCALLGGLGPGLLSLVVAALAQAVFFIEPIGKLFPMAPQSALRLGLFIGLGLINVLLASSFREAFRQISRDRTALEAARSLLDAIVENLPAMIFVKDARDLSFVLFNRVAEETFGWPRAEMYGKTDYDFFPKQEADSFRANDIAVLTSKKLLEIFEEPMKSRNKGERVLHTKKVPIISDRGEPLYLLGIAEDITERSLAERERRELLIELERSVRAREHVLAVVSHDLKNPLSAIKMAARVLERFSAHDERAKSLVQTINASASRMEHLIRDIVDLAAFEAGSLVIDKKPQDVREVFSSLKPEMRPLAERKSIRLSFHSSLAPDKAVLGDSNRIKQVLSNLIGNAIRYTPEKGSVTVSARENGDFVRLEVADTGPGISEELFPHLFKRYWRAEASSSGHAGLGLSIAKAIAEAHGGQIGVESKVGVGSTFWVTLPIAISVRKTA
ncbi:MAG: hypothetical protein A2X94_07380 [Bdellovibrionales bacterium GWB1_55_8]|nr:MAG: hypothetical protein A2X94_07380 [Bdellovibrionales bacterium GWB1_55_8]